MAIGRPCTESWVPKLWFDRLLAGSNNPCQSTLVPFFSAPWLFRLWRGLPGSVWRAPGHAVSTDALRYGGCERALWASPVTSDHPPAWFVWEKLVPFSQQEEVSKVPPGQGNFTSASFHSLPSPPLRLPFSVQVLGLLTQGLGSGMPMAHWFFCYSGRI